MAACFLRTARKPLPNRAFIQNSSRSEGADWKAQLKKEKSEGCATGGRPSAKMRHAQRAKRLFQRAAVILARPRGGQRSHDQAGDVRAHPGRAHGRVSAQSGVFAKAKSTCDQGRARGRSRCLVVVRCRAALVGGASRSFTRQTYWGPVMRCKNNKKDACEEDLGWCQRGKSGRAITARRQTPFEWLAAVARNRKCNMTRAPDKRNVRGKFAHQSAVVSTTSVTAYSE